MAACARATLTAHIAKGNATLPFTPKFLALNRSPLPGQLPPRQGARPQYKASPLIFSCMTIRLRARGIVIALANSSRARHASQHFYLLPIHLYITKAAAGDSAAIAVASPYHAPPIAGEYATATSTVITPIRKMMTADI